MVGGWGEVGRIGGRWVTVQAGHHGGEGLAAQWHSCFALLTLPTQDCLPSVMPLASHQYKLPPSLPPPLLFTISATPMYLDATPRISTQS